MTLALAGEAGIQAGNWRSERSNKNHLSSSTDAFVLIPLKSCNSSANNNSTARNVRSLLQRADLNGGDYTVFLDELVINMLSK